MKFKDILYEQEGHSFDYVFKKVEEDFVLSSGNEVKYYISANGIARISIRCGIKVSDGIITTAMLDEIFLHAVNTLKSKGLDKCKGWDSTYIFISNVVVKIGTVSVGCTEVEEPGGHIIDSVEFKLPEVNGSNLKDLGWRDTFLDLSNVANEYDMFVKKAHTIIKPFKKGTLTTPNGEKVNYELGEYKIWIDKSLIHNETHKVVFNKHITFYDIGGNGYGYILRDKLEPIFEKFGYELVIKGVNNNEHQVIKFWKNEV